MKSRLLLPAAIATLLLAGCAPGRDAAPFVSAPADTSGPPLERVGAERLKALAAAPGARATLLSVWASWCGPCREEFPALYRVMRRHPEARWLLVSADFDAQLGEARRFLRDHGITDTTYLKQGGDQPFIDALAPEWSGSLPATILYDARGRRVAFWEGAGDSARFEAALAQAEGSHPSPEGTR